MVAVTLNTADKVTLQAGALVASGNISGTSSTITLSKAATTTTLSASANPSAYGQSVIYTATVSTIAPGNGVPNGYVNFVVDSKAPVAVPLNSPSQASLTLPSFSVGTHTINASYLGSTSDLASQANATQTVNLALSPATLPAATTGQAYSQQISASGGSAIDNYSYALASGALPTGLALSSTGLLSGTTTVGNRTYNFSIKAMDNSLAGVTGTQSFTLTVNPAPMIVSFGAFSPSTVTAGGIFGSTITIKDKFGNPYNGKVNLSASDGQKLNVPSFTMSGGSTFVNFQLFKADTITLTATAVSAPQVPARVPAVRSP
jgi:hypothetical protein